MICADRAVVLDAAVFLVVAANVALERLVGAASCAIQCQMHLVTLMACSIDLKSKLHVLILLNYIIDDAMQY